MDIRQTKPTEKLRQAKRRILYCLQKNQRPTTHKSHKNTEIEAIKYAPRTWNKPCACWFSLCEFIWVFLILIYMALFPLGLLCPLALTLHSASSSTIFPRLWVGWLDGDISFRAACSKVSHSLCNICLWVSVFIPTCCRRMLLWWWLNKVLSNEYGRI